MTCFGLAERDCSRLLAGMLSAESAITFFWRFGLTGSILALALILIQRVGGLLVETFRDYFLASPRATQATVQTVEAMTDVM